MPEVISFRPSSDIQLKNEEIREIRKKPRGKAEDNITEFITFLKTIYILLQSGQSHSNIVDMLFEDSYGDFKIALEPIAKEVKGGKHLEEAFADSSFFPADFAQIFKVGAESGKLDKAMKRYISYAERVMEMRKMLRGAMVYPTVMVSFIFCAVVFIIVFVIPIFKEIVEDITIGMAYVELNLTTNILFGMHSIFEPLGKIVPLILMALFIVYMFRWGKIKMAGFFERSIPKLREVKNELDWGQWLSLGGISIHAGMDPPTMLEMLKDGHIPKEIKEHYKDITSAVVGGKTLSGELKNHKVPGKISTMLSVAEKTGNIDKALEDLGEIMLSGVDYKIKNVTEILNPIITLVVAVFVGFAAGSLFSVMNTIHALATQM